MKKLESLERYSKYYNFLVFKNFYASGLADSATDTITKQINNLYQKHKIVFVDKGFDSSHVTYYTSENSSSNFDVIDDELFTIPSIELINKRLLENVFNQFCDRFIHYKSIYDIAFDFLLFEGDLETNPVFESLVNERQNRFGILYIDWD